MPANDAGIGIPGGIAKGAVGGLVSPSAVADTEAEGDAMAAPAGGGLCEGDSGEFSAPADMASRE
jgi:hypothetical protein